MGQNFRPQVLIIQPASLREYSLGRLLILITDALHSSGCRYTLLWNCRLYPSNKTHFRTRHLTETTNLFATSMTSSKILRVYPFGTRRMNQLLRPPQLLHQRRMFHYQLGFCLFDELLNRVNPDLARMQEVINSLQQGGAGSGAGSAHISGINLSNQNATV